MKKGERRIDNEGRVEIAMREKENSSKDEGTETTKTASEDDDGDWKEAGQSSGEIEQRSKQVERLQRMSTITKG